MLRESLFGTEEGGAGGWSWRGWGKRTYARGRIRASTPRVTVRGAYCKRLESKHGRSATRSQLAFGNPDLAQSERHVLVHSTTPAAPSASAPVVGQSAREGSKPYLLTVGARHASFRNINIRTIRGPCRRAHQRPRAPPRVTPTQNSLTLTLTIKKKDEIERVAKANR